MPKTPRTIWRNKGGAKYGTFGFEPRSVWLPPEDAIRDAQQSASREALALPGGVRARKTSAR